MKSNEDDMFWVTFASHEKIAASLCSSCFPDCLLTVIFFVAENSKPHADPQSSQSVNFCVYFCAARIGEGVGADWNDIFCSFKSKL